MAVLDPPNPHRDLMMTATTQTEVWSQPDDDIASPGARAPSQAVTVIEPARGWQLINLRELWNARELLGFLTWRDVKIRYKQTVLGAAWALLQPALMMVVFTIFFGRLARVYDGPWPYPLFAYAGLLPWTFFATALAQGGNSVVGSERLITKIYFPRLAIPFATVGAAVVDFVIALGLLAIMMVYYGVFPGPQLLLMPVVFALVLLMALGTATLLAALNVSYRDFRYVIPFLVQLWMFATPAVYMDVANGPATATTTSETKTAAATTSANVAAATPPTAKGGTGLLRLALTINPMNGLITAFRATMLGGAVPWAKLAVAATCAVVVFVIGCLYFRRVEDAFADII